jgi:glycosyltransferase involved in cell wall biosynthesis
MSDILCFSHLRWNFVYQRPQHLLSRFSRFYRVIFWEEPVFDSFYDYNEVSNEQNSDVWIVVPHIRPGLKPEEITEAQKILLGHAMKNMAIKQYILWYYSPMALLFSDHLQSRLIVYDCMDELSAFKFASPLLKQQEEKLFRNADIVFTGGISLYDAKKRQHINIHPFPSSIDKEHFFTARVKRDEPADQKDIPGPRLGFYGVIDERINIDLLQKIAEMRPDWHFILVGPIVKIDPASLPCRDNIHFLGSKSYHELPNYLSGWDIAIMPFALNESTRYISPTKTPEFLAGGKPVISTSINDVIHPYGEKGLVRIADTAEEFITAADCELQNKADVKWLGKVDNYLSGISWDKTWRSMSLLIDNAIIEKNLENSEKSESYV